MVMAEENRLSKKLSGGKAEIRVQSAINLALCNCDGLLGCLIKIDGVFSEATTLTPDQAVVYARQFESDGVNAALMMSTADVNSTETSLRQAV